MNRTQVAILVGVWATFALDVYSAMNSSPQTTEINASARADTLMKWVMLADGIALGGGLAGTVITKSAVPLISTFVVVAGMHYLYAHAKRSGLENGGAPTESY